MLNVADLRDAELGYYGTISWPCGFSRSDGAESFERRHFRVAVEDRINVLDDI
jgi:hypothetical protein